MEGPSLLLAEEQLAAFKGRTIRVVSGNTKIGKERLLGKEVKDIFSWGKHLVFQVDDIAMRIHFLLFGTFAATAEGQSVTGDYKKTREPRLLLSFDNGSIEMYNCSIKVFEEKNLKKTYDFSRNIMTKTWDSNQALHAMQQFPEEEVADVLLDQNIFAGVGNIIKNEVLFIKKIHPKTHIAQLSKKQLIDLISETKEFSHQFYEWRKIFQLRKHLQIHRKGKCPECGEKLIREKTGKRTRWSYWCPVHQPLL